jgi:class 3 adenylate cyclase
MREILRAYQNAVAGEVTRLEGHVAKFMGDGVLAYFGWPRAHEDEAERAVRAGLAITATVGVLDGRGMPLSCRIGIATGVIIGDLSEGAAQEEAVVADAQSCFAPTVIAKRTVALRIDAPVGGLFQYSDPDHD